MSLAGHVLCQRMLIGPCARAMPGAVTVAAAAAAAPLRNSRRGCRSPAATSLFVMGASLKHVIFFIWSRR